MKFAHFKNIFFSEGLVFSFTHAITDSTFIASVKNERNYIYEGLTGLAEVHSFLKKRSRCRFQRYGLSSYGSRRRRNTEKP